MFYQYNNYAQHLRNTFGFRLQKLSVNAGFTCPNRDGSKGVGGCTFCNNEAFYPSYCAVNKSITQQLQEGIEFHKERYKRVPKYAAFFQAYSNTYAPLDVLKQKYEEALSVDDVVGLIIATRSDCLDDEKLNYIAELSQKYYVVLEIGIESCYDETLELINRKEKFADIRAMIKKAVAKGIKVGGHLIFGFPNETREMLLNEAAIINELELYSLKMHQLQIIKGTAMAENLKTSHSEQSEEAQQLTATLPYYLDFVIDFTARLDPKIIIERIANEVPPRFLLSQSWGKIRNDQIMQMFNERMLERGITQGTLLNISS
jgi:radical SAM protein (TIGR01212 family)